MTQTTVQLLPNKGWDSRILAFQFDDLVTCFAVISERYVVLLDTMFNSESAQQMMDHLLPYLNNKRQLLVINTHSDWDHCWGNQLFSGADAVYPAPIIASRGCANDFRTGVCAATLAEMQTQSSDVYGEVTLIKPTLIFEQKLTIVGGDLTFELFPAVGHTHDHISIYIPEIKTLFAADAAERPYPQPRKPEFMPQMRQTLAELAALETDVVLYCHADDIDAAAIHGNIAYFDFIEQQCRAALAAGVVLPDSDLAAIATLIDCPYATAMRHDPAADEYNEFYKAIGHSGQIQAIWLQIANEQ